MKRPPVRSLSAEQFRDVIGRFASGVTVVTATLDGKHLGTTASAISSLSLEPPMVLACMNRSSVTGRAIAAARAFAINILGEDQPALARRFATKDPEKFSGVAVTIGPDGQPLLANAIAHLECWVVEAVEGGTHTVFFAEVTSAASRDGAPLAYFRGEFARLQRITIA